MPRQPRSTPQGLILVPARSGSTRVKNKNIRLLGGRPLIEHVITAATKSRLGRVIVSTDSESIASVARDAGAETPFLRPAELSGAEASSRWVILHALRWLAKEEGWRPEWVAFCPPTNPFLQPKTLKAMAETLKSRADVNSIVTITRPKTHPFRILSKETDGRIKSGIIALEGKTIHDLERTQDWPQVWEGSPACRMTRSRYFEALLASGKEIREYSGKTYDPASCLGYAIDAIEAADIDGEEDWAIAEALYRAFRMAGSEKALASV